MLALIADLAVATGSLPSGRVGTPYNAATSADGGTAPYSWQASGLAAGLSIDTASGQISGTPRAAGTVQVVLSVSDRFGIVAKSQPIALTIAPAQPQISKLRQSHRRWREGHRLAKTSSLALRRKGGRAPLGTTFTFKLNTKAEVRLAFAAPKKSRRGKRAAVAMLSFNGHPGTNRVAFQGRISSTKKLRPGRYTVAITATNSAGLRSAPRSLSFTIVR